MTDVQRRATPPRPGWYPAQDGSARFQRWTGDRWAGYAFFAAAPVSILSELSPEQAQAEVLQRVALAGGAVVTNVPGAITGQIIERENPNPLVAIILFFIFIVPMIVYLITATRQTVCPFTVQFSAEGERTRVRTGGSGKGLIAASRAALALPRKPDSGPGSE